jgi:hypothetical protein
MREALALLSEYPEDPRVRTATLKMEAIYGDRSLTDAANEIESLGKDQTDAWYYTLQAASLRWVAAPAKGQGRELAATALGSAALDALEIDPRNILAMGLLAESRSVNPDLTLALSPFDDIRRQGMPPWPELAGSEFRIACRAKDWPRAREAWSRAQVLTGRSPRNGIWRFYIGRYRKILLGASVISWGLSLLTRSPWLLGLALIPLGLLLASDLVSAFSPRVSTRLRKRARRSSLSIAVIALFMAYAFISASTTHQSGALYHASTAIGSARAFVASFRAAGANGVSLTSSTPLQATSCSALNSAFPTGLRADERFTSDLSFNDGSVSRYLIGVHGAGSAWQLTISSSTQIKQAIRAVPPSLVAVPGDPNPVAAAQLFVGAVTSNNPKDAARVDASGEAPFIAMWLAEQGPTFASSMKSIDCAMMAASEKQAPSIPVGSLCYSVPLVVGENTGTLQLAVAPIGSTWAVVQSTATITTVGQLGG